MNTFLMIVGFFGAFIFAIMTLVAWVRRTSKSRLYFILAVICFFLFVYGFANMEVEELDTATEEVATEERGY